MITRLFYMCLAFVLASFHALGQCQYPSGFSYTYGSICWGYAQARAFGCDSIVAATVYPNPPKIFSQFFTLHSPGSYQVGDIIVFGSSSSRIEDLGYLTGHASFVAEIKESNVKPDGSLIRSRGLGVYKVRDEDPVVDNAQIIMHEVSGAGGGHTRLTLAALISARQGVNEVIKGVYRLRENHMDHYVSFANSFGSGRIGVGVFDNGTGEHVGRSSPFFDWFEHLTVVPVRAYTPQQHTDGQWFSFNNAWRNIDNTTVATSAITNITIVASNTYTAFFAPSSPSNSVYFDLRSDGQSIGSILKVNGATHTAPTPPFAPGAVCSLHQYLYRDRVTYQFQSWNDGNTSLSRSFLSAGSFVANYSFVEVLPPADISLFNNPVGEPIKITWTAHPSPYVTQYEVWRKVKNVEGPTLIATLAKTQTEFIDGDYFYTDGYTHNLIDYDIRARYVTPSRSVTSNPSWLNVFGMPGMYVPEARPEEEPSALELQQDPEFAIAAHPNPFNPTTKITTTLPSVAHVEIAMYDMAGRLVARLADRIFEAGTHAFDWSARATGTGTLVSGVYIARVVARPLDGSPPMRQSLKLILAK